MKTIIIAILFFLCSLSLTAQVKDSIADVLKFQIEKAATDSNKVPLLLQLADHIYKSDVEEATSEVVRELPEC